MINGQDMLIVALEGTFDEAKAWAQELEGSVKWVKIGMSLFYQTGPESVAYFKERGFKVFLDLKVHDIAHQVQLTFEGLAQLGADMVTIHASGGAAMIQAARAGADAGALRSGHDAPIILAVTVLTSLSEQDIHAIGVESSIPSQVERLAKLAYYNGADGIVCSPQESRLVRAALGPDAYIVTPGVRMSDDTLDDQVRVTTPAEACRAGSTHVVVGRPITQAPHSLTAAEKIMADLTSALAHDWSDQ